MQRTNTCFSLGIKVLPKEFMVQINRWLESLQMKHMTELELHFWPLWVDTLACLARCLRSAYQMQQVTMFCGSSNCGPDCFKGLPAMPLRGVYTVTGPACVGECPDSVMDELHLTLEARGFSVECCHGECIEFRSPDAEKAM